MRSPTGAGYTLTPDGLFDDQPAVAAATEARRVCGARPAVDRAGVARGPGRDRGGLDGSLPRLISLDDLRGDLHCHTNWTDGTDSLEEMATAARARGYQYMALTDHSRSLTITNGLSLERLEEARRLVEQRQPAAGAVRRAARDRDGHPAGRLARLPGRDARHARLCLGIGPQWLQAARIAA